METPANKAILYDDNCPMCALYTRGFVQWGVLQPENRIPFTQVSQQLQPRVLATQLDTCRARHEIPLVDLAGGPTLYGLDAMLYLLGQRIPFVTGLARIKPMYRFFRFLYSLVSYNRRIIVPSSSQAVVFDCTPDFHTGYRLAFIGYALVLASLVTYTFGHSVTAFWPTENPGALMLLLCGTGWLLQMGWASLLLSDKRIDYLGHLSVLMIIGVLMLVPGMVIGWLTDFQYVQIPMASVVLSSSVMLWQHIRRIRLLGLSQWWTVAWFATLQITAVGWLLSGIGQP